MRIPEKQTTEIGVEHIFVSSEGKQHDCRENLSPNAFIRTERIRHPLRSGMLAGAMSLKIGRSFLSGPIIAVCLPRPSSKSGRLFRSPERSFCTFSDSRYLTILSSTYLRTSIWSSSGSVKTFASLANSGEAQRTSWDEAADTYFSNETGTETTTSKAPGVKKWASPANRERQDFRGKSDGYQGEGSSRAASYRKAEPVERERKDVERKSGYGAERNRSDQWQRPARGYRSRDGGAYNGGSGSDWQTRGRKTDSSWSNNYNRGQDDRPGFGDDRRWQSRELSAPLQVEGQALYGVAPIISALKISRRTFHCLYMQENLLLNIGSVKRKDKSAVTAIERMARAMGVTVKEASKHDMNILVDNRPHQGLILDASPLELLPVDMLDAPVYQKGKPPPVWVALDEVTDPQNFGAILRSAYFLGAEGVVVCAKNSAPLSGIVSKASAGAMEVMEVLFCKNMVRFLDSCQENAWRIVGASAERSSVPVRQLPHGIATVLVLGSEGKGLRTNVKRACDQLVTIAGTSSGDQRPKYDFAAQDIDDEESDVEVDEEVGRRGTELSLIPGPSAVDSLNVSVAAGILLYELLDSPPARGVETLSH